MDIPVGCVTVVMWLVLVHDVAEIFGFMHQPQLETTMECHLVDATRVFRTVRRVALKPAAATIN
jgi:hypothetical protein